MAVDSLFVDFFHDDNEFKSVDLVKNKLHVLLVLDGVVGVDHDDQEIDSRFEKLEVFALVY